jgi:alpha-L-fucosidase
VKSAARLFALYEQSVGRNCVLLLNVPPDRRGLIAEEDAAALAGMRTAIDRTYGADLAVKAAVSASHPEEQSHPAAAVVDGRPGTFWVAPEGVASPALALKLPAPLTFDRVLLQEAIEHGQRIESFLVEAAVDGAWRRLATGTTVGYKRIVMVPPTRASEVRVTIVQSRARPTLATFGLHRVR